MPAVSILLVTWNSKDHIRLCLESLFALPGTRELEVIVVDNGSVDCTAEFVSKTWPHVRLIGTGRNLGFAPAMNLAVAAARGEKILWLNPDTRIAPSAVDELADYLDAHPETGAVGPVLVDADGNREPFAARQFPSLRNAFIRHFGLRWASGARGILGSETFSLGGSPTAVDCLCGAVMMIRRRVADEIGPLDVTIPMYFEDLDYCARIATKRWNIVCIPSVTVTHDGARSTAMSSDQLLLHAMEDGHAPLLFMKKYRGQKAALMFRAVVLCGSLLRVLVLSGLARNEPLRRRAWNLVRWAMTPSRIFESRVARHFDSVPTPENAVPERWRLA